MAIGADRVIMTKQAALGPIDPSVNNPLNPQADIGGTSRAVPVSAAAREELNIQRPQCPILTGLTNYIYPFSVGGDIQVKSEDKVRESC